ncbi:hypothetical protein UB46_24160 [Burkholderiaceae bacterium 16]|nr:hypothetical protein UB46_24160 [Burkholderiaceae bacterium 16]
MRQQAREDAGGAMARVVGAADGVNAGDGYAVEHVRVLHGIGVHHTLELAGRRAQYPGYRGCGAS